MLPAAARMTASSEFDTTVRRGIRAGRPALVVHYRAAARDPQERAAAGSSPVDAADVGSPRIGFVVGKVAGGAVVRNRIRRRLRHLMRERLERLPPGSALVVRASAAAGERSSVELAQELDQLLGKVLRRASGSRS